MILSFTVGDNSVVYIVGDQSVEGVNYWTFFYEIYLSGQNWIDIYQVECGKNLQLSRYSPQKAIPFPFVSCI